MIRRDLNEARAAWLQTFQDARQRTEMEQGNFLAYRDSSDRVIDFHALRHTYISRIVQSGASAKVCQTLARHGDVRLTLGRYAHVGLHDLTAAVEGMPSLVAAIPRPKRWPRRGRTGKRRKEGKKSLAQTLAYRRIVWGILGDKAGRKTRKRGKRQTC